MNAGSHGERDRPLRLDWFSPLPPERSGIAEFTQALAPALARRAAVRFVTQAERVPRMPGSVVAAFHDLSAEDLNRSDVAVYNVGNNAAFHGDAWRLSLVHPGLVVLHDVRLQHLFAGLLLVAERNPAAYVALMESAYGAAATDAARLMAAGKVAPESIAERFPLVEAAIDGALAVVVHSAEAQAIVQARSRVPVLRLDLPYASRAAPSAGIAPWRESGVRLLAFGYIGPNRRIESVLRAIAASDTREGCTLHVVGEVWNERRLRDLAAGLGIAPALQVHGHVPSEALDAHLARADLVVNLRWPSMGEASYSLLRAWDHALPVLVTDTGWYAELDRGAVVHVDPDDEVRQVAQVIDRCARDRAALGAIGARGRALLLAKHQPAAYVERVIELARSADGADAGRRRLATRLARELRRHSADGRRIALQSLAAALGDR